VPPKYEIVNADCLSHLRTLKDESIQCCVTSPPYFGLRDYGTAKWEGGDANCDHAGAKKKTRYDYALKSSLGPTGKQTQQSNATSAVPACAGTCACGAVRVDRQMGLEKTPAEYIAGMVAVFREVRRVLRKDGTLWLNIGDSYASASKGSGGPSVKQLSNASQRYSTIKLNHGVKEKDLIGIPWMLAFALRADGWYLRSDIIWHKPNPMPESVTDRPTKAHEYLFLLTKSQKYFYDNEAVKELTVSEHEAKWRNTKHGWGGGVSHTGEGSGRKFGADASKRNRRSVWTITTQPFKGAHFAVMPAKLVEPCILAGSSAKSCEHCGKCYERQTEKHVKPKGRAKPGTYTHDAHTTPQSASYGKNNNLGGDPLPIKTTGFIHACDCGSVDPVPSTVLDPFSGAATVGLVAVQHGRDYIGIELNPTYAKMGEKRIADSLLPKPAKKARKNKKATNNALQLEL
jgi:DNA modification methylase